MPADLEREVIALACRGFLAVDVAAALPCEAFTGAPRLFAWAAACVSLRAMGRDNRFQAARLMLVRAPRLALPLDVWAELQRDAHAELNAAEKVDTFDPLAPRRLLHATETAADEGPHDTKGTET
jgi:hypothetical protein